MAQIDELRRQVMEAEGSPETLRRLYARLTAEVGDEAASRLWWAVFSETDATHT